MANKDMAGTKFGEFEFPVERGKIKEFANAICDANPVYRDREYARNKGFNDILMPVTFPMTFVFHLPSDNYVLEATRKLGMDPAKSVHGEMEIIYQRPVCAGETLRGEISIGDIYKKEGKYGGTMTLVEMKINFYDAEDKPVIIVRNIFIERG
jgi:acyl dehydratase